MERVSVSVRVRPRSQAEKDAGNQNFVQCSANQIALARRKFAYDQVFDASTENLQIFDTVVRPLLADVISGINVTLMVYGQTGAGKTHTMSYLTSAAMKEILSQSSSATSLGGESTASSSGFNYSISIAEIYNEKIYDLQNLEANVNLMESDGGVVVAHGLGRTPLKGVDDGVGASIMEEAESVITTAAQHRATAPTLLNQTSSRSHLLTTLHLDGKNISSSITFVDLAGSERLKQSHGYNATGVRVKELVSINSGLLALGNVIVALHNQAAHVPFRSSKLTRILQQALSGNSRTALIACISPTDSTFEESLNTLKYAYRAKSLKVKPIVNPASVASATVGDEGTSSEKDLRLRLAKVEADLLAEKRLSSQLEADLFKAECATLEEKEKRQELQALLKSLGCEGQSRSEAENLKSLKDEREALLQQRFDVEQEIKRIASVDENRMKIDQMEAEIKAKEEHLNSARETQRQQNQQYSILEKRLADLANEKQKLTADLMSAERRLEHTQMESEARDHQRAQLQKSFEARLRAAEASIQQYRRRLKEVASTATQHQQQSTPTAPTTTTRGNATPAEKELNELRQAHKQLCKLVIDLKAGNESTVLMKERLEQLQQRNNELSAAVQLKEEEIESASLTETITVREKKRRAELKKLEDVENELSQAWQERERLAANLDQLRRGSDVKRRKKVLDGWMFRLKGVQQQLNDPNATEEQKRYAAAEAEIANRKIQDLHRSLPEVNDVMEQLEADYHLVDDRVDSLSAAKEFHINRLKVLADKSIAEDQSDDKNQDGSGTTTEEKLEESQKKLLRTEDLLEQQKIQITELIGALAEKDKLLETILRGQNPIGRK